MNKKNDIYTEEEIQHIVDLVKKGYSYRRVSEMTGRTMGGVAQVMYKWRKKGADTPVEQKKEEEKMVPLMVGGVKVGEAKVNSVETANHTVEPEKFVKKLTKEEKENFTKSIIAPKPVVEKTATLSPREMIKALYDQGYRIENNSLVCYVRTPVNVKDIIAGL